MSRFKIGQRVVAVLNQPQGRFKKGDEIVVDGFTCCPSCGILCIYLVGFNKLSNSECGECSKIDSATRECYEEASFAPIQSFGEQIEEQLSKEANEVSDWILEATQPKP